MLQKNVPFDEWFRVEAVQQYHRALTAETFMRDLAPTVWPEGKRIGWCWLPQKKNDGETYCPMKEGNGHAFWNMFWQILMIVKFTWISVESASIQNDSGGSTR